MKVRDYQVLQRDLDNVARVTLDSGETVELPIGGPYEVGGATNVLVGDLWVLAGQSNMEGVGILRDIETPSPYVHSFQSHEAWAVAEEPLHWLGESPRPIHRTLMELPPEPDLPEHRGNDRTTGAGLGLSFAKERYARTAVPVGLIPSAHGGTSMQQWDPALRHLGGASLYGATLSRIEEVGGRVAGILWYQGESDATAIEAPYYTDRMRRLITAFRTDLARADLPFYYVQIGRFIQESSQDLIDGWNSVREAQRQLSGTLPGTSMVASVDLDLDDLIHISTGGLKRLGRRLADTADDLQAPDVAEVRRISGVQIEVQFRNVRGGLRAAGRPTGFTLRNGAGTPLPLIYAVTLQDDSVILQLASDLIPEDTSLWYGWGLDPYCNITDGADAAIPAFGPLPIG